MKNSNIRHTIISTASDLFYTKGYNSTGVNEIIKEANIAKATLYSHFRSKEEICVAYLQYKHNAFIKNIRDFSLEYNDGKDKVLSLFDFLMSFFSKTDFNGCWCINTIAEIPKDNKNIQNEIVKQKQELITFIEELISDNLSSISKEDINTLSKRIYLLYEGAVTESKLHKSDWPIKEMKKICEYIIK